ncbi:MAG TPA: LemA family protein [candidate division Zixibacteria bacterium]|nr:LemA family protein [candidate division Zixibacteria bacterium]MDD4916401.1 LemA family protein [candidate division Zixibacteria bacterium]MDM7974221.1 LemA family protein [candidate division Zixibacteria bacterium]HOD65674.1 LemA family protein [candidate division Zixibacteria bacterium]HOZ07539.1 LemA family protein [candidate division Zixibacteria bacterium]
MKVLGIALAVILILVLAVAGWIWSGRGGLIDRSQAIDEKWAQVQNVYQRRFDLVPNLVASVDNFMERQQATLTEVIAMRQRVIDLTASAESALGSGNPALLDSLAGQLSRQLNSFINVVVERYPEIKGDQLYADLMTQLEGTENRIAQERRVYNEAVREYNVYRQRGVKALIAGAVFGFPYAREFFAAQSEAQTAPSVRDAFEKK